MTILLAATDPAWDSGDEGGPAFWGLIAIILAVAIIRGMRRFARHRSRIRIARRLCPQCGYDLRATPTRCPECGHTPELPA